MVRCIDTSVGDDSVSALIQAAVNCDIDAIIDSVSPVILSDVEAVIIEAGFSAEQAGQFRDCVSVELARVTEDELVDMAIGVADTGEFGFNVGEVVGAPCTVELLADLAGEGAPDVLELAAELVQIDAPEAWSVVGPLEVGEGISTTLLEHADVIVALVSIDSSGGVVSAELEFDPLAGSTDVVRQSLNTVLASFNLDIDASTTTQLLAGATETTVGEFSVCTWRDDLVAIRVLRSSFGCDR